MNTETEIRRKKIGLRFGVIRDGVSPKYTSEGAKEWEKYYVDDPRLYISDLLEEKTDDFIDFVCYGDNVAIYVINRRITGRGADQIFANIFIPTDIKIDFKILVNLINKVKNEYLKVGTALDAIKKDADKTFDVEYAVNETLKETCTWSYHHTGYAYQCYDDEVYRLDELLQENLFCPCYNYYRAVFLLNGKVEIKIRPKINRLEDRDVRDFVLLKYPYVEDEKMFTFEVNGVELTKQGYPTTFNKNLTIIIKKTHFIDSNIDVNTGKENVYDFTKKLKEVKFDRLLRIRKENFMVLNRQNEQIDFTLKVFSVNKNPYKIDKTNSSCEIKESELESVLIESEGYESHKIDKTTMAFNDNDFEFVNNGWLIKRKFDVKLKSNIYEHKFVVRSIIDDKYDIEFEIKTNNKDVNRSPLKGYKINKNRNGTIRLEAEEEKTFKFDVKLLTCIVVVLLMGLTGGFFIGRIGDKGQNSEIETLVERSKTQEETIREQSGEISKLKEGIKELEKEKQELITQSYSLLVNGAKWWREDFKKAGYEDLYDALNKYEFAKVIEYSKDIPAEKGSSWESIIKFCKKHTKENIIGQYSNDGSITIESWKKHVEKKSSVQPGNANKKSSPTDNKTTNGAQDGNKQKPRYT